MLQSGRIPGARLPGLRLPLAASADPLGQSVIWLRLLEEAGFLQGRKSPVTLILPAAAQDPGSLWVVLRPPRQEDFALLTGAPEGYLGPPPPGLPSPEVTGRSSFQEAVSQQLLGAGTPLGALAQFPLLGAP